MGKILAYGEITITNLTEPFHVLLTNEAQQFVTNSFRVVTSAQSYYTDIIVYQGGTERTDYTIGTISSANNITVSKTSSRVTFSVSANATISADSGTFTIPITLDGETVNKVFSWSCAKQGATGSTGADGVGIASVTEYYAVSSSNSTAPTSWQTTVPTMTTTNKYLWNYEKTTYTDSSTSETAKRVIGVYGNTGATGAKGDAGADGADGKGIKSITEYYALSFSNETAPPEDGVDILNLTDYFSAEEDDGGSYIVSVTPDSIKLHAVKPTSYQWKIIQLTSILTVGKTYKLSFNMDGTNANIGIDEAPDSAFANRTKTNAKEITVQEGYYYRLKIYYNTSNAPSTLTYDNTYTNVQLVEVGTSGWTTDECPVTDETNRYLWNYEKITYTDGTSEKSTVRVIGTHGATGIDAQTINITASSQVFKSTDGGATFSPDTITLTPTFQGGISYSKWQYSTNGGSTWTDLSNGSHSCTITSGILTINKSCDLFTDAITTVSFKCISNNASYYDIMTVLKLYDVTGLQIGGRNLFKGTRLFDSDYWGNAVLADWEEDATFKQATITSTTSAGAPTTVATPTASQGFDFSNKNKTFTISCMVKGTQENQSIGITLDASRIGYSVKPVTNGVWSKLVWTFNGSGTLQTFRFQGGENISTDYPIYMAQVKCEYGNIATDWTPAPEDLESQIIENKNTINNVSLLVDKQQQEINAKVSTTTFEESIELLQNDIEEASQGLGKWLIEIYPKSLFDSSYQSRYDLPVFMSKENIVPSKSLLVADTDLSSGSNYADSYIGYGLTFVECRVAFSLTVPLYYNDSFTLYLNNQQIRSATSTANSTSTNVSVTLAFRAGWNCLEIVWNDANGIDGFRFGTPISQNANVTSMNCYYASITGRESQIVDNYAKLNVSLQSIQAKVSSTETLVSEHDDKIQSLNERFAEIELTDEKIEMTVSNKISELVVGTRNLIRNSTNLIYADYSFNSDTQLTSANGTVLTDESENILLA